MSSEPSPARGFVELRDATVADAAVIAEVHHDSRVAALKDLVPPELFQMLSPDERRARWREWLSDPTWLTMVGERQGHVMGFCTVGPSRDGDVDPAVVAEMPTLYVHPLHWHQGIGRVLCAAAVSRVTAQGYRELSLWTLEANHNARLFYASFGFTPDGTTKLDDDPVPTDLLALRLRIALDSR